MYEGTWTIRPCPHRAQAELVSSLGISELTAGVLVRRGYGDPEQARAFLAVGAARRRCWRRASLLPCLARFALPRVDLRDGRERADASSAKVAFKKSLRVARVSCPSPFNPFILSTLPVPVVQRIEQGFPNPTGFPSHEGSGASTSCQKPPIRA